MKLSDLEAFIKSIPPDVRRANPEVTLWVPAINQEFALHDADFDAHGKPPLWVTLNAEKAAYEREGWWETGKKGKKAS